MSRPLMRLIAVVALACPAIAPAQEPAVPTGLALVDATVIDGTGAPPRPGMTIVIREGRIEDLYPTGSRPLPSDIRVEDLRGRFVIPGLIDAHAHVGLGSPGAQLRALRLQLRGGVTTIRDPAGDPRITGYLSRRALLGEIDSPDIFYAALMGGPGFAEYAPVAEVSRGWEPGTAPWAREVGEGTDFARVIAEARGTGATGIKMYRYLSPELASALAAEAHRQGMRVWSHTRIRGHTGTDEPSSRPSEVVAARADVLSHANHFACEVMRCATGEERSRAVATVDPAHPAIRAVLARMAEQGAILDPTLSNLAGLESEPHWLRFAAAVTRLANEAGVPIAAGTDVPLYAQAGPLPHLHDELELLVTRAGLSPGQAIVAATRTAAQTVGQEGDRGTIETGKRADLVVLREDPYLDIRNTRSVDLVLKDGRIVHDPRAAAIRPPVGQATLDRPVSGPEASDTLALTNVTVIDGTGAPPRPGMTVLIAGDRIEAVFPTDVQAVPASARVLDLEGHYLIPGLINTHIHLPMLGWSRDSVAMGLKRMLHAGVTTVRKMAGDTRVAAELNRAALIEGAPFPTIHYAVRMAGPTFYGSRAGWPSWIGYEPGRAPWAQAVTAETDMARAVAVAAGTGATGLKLYADLDADVVRRLVEEAHRQGLKAWAHGTVFPTGPLEAVRAGIDGLSHVCFLFWGLQPVVAASMAERAPYDPDHIDLEAGPFQELLREMLARDVVLDATARNASRNPGAHAAGCTPELLIASLRAAHRTGVRISTGTDYVTADGDPDPTLFTEIEYLVDTGVLSPLEAITAATLNGARATGIDDSYGSVEPGKLADLVVLSADPTEDIDHLRAIVAVIKHGRLYRRSAYDGGPGRELFGRPVPPGDTGWTDTSPHQVRVVSVAPDVQLEVLDWGGDGSALVFLAGLSMNAHAFDHFAPRFTDTHRVVGITRRGHGASSWPDDGYSLERRVEDLRVVLDSLGLERVVFAGHSMAGTEMTRFAGGYPERVAGLVYIDAAYDPPLVESLRIPELCPLGPEVLKAIERRFENLEAFRRTQRREAADGTQGPFVSDTAVAQLIAGFSRRHDYSAVRAPSLAVYHTPRWVEDVFGGEAALSPGCVSGFQRYIYEGMAGFAAGMERGRIVALEDTQHNIHLVSPDALEEVMRRWLAELPEER